MPAEIPDIYSLDRFRDDLVENRLLLFLPTNIRDEIYSQVYPLRVASDPSKLIPLVKEIGRILRPCDSEIGDDLLFAQCTIQAQCELGEKLVTTERFYDYQQIANNLPTVYFNLDNQIERLALANRRQKDYRKDSDQVHYLLEPLREFASFNRKVFASLNLGLSFTN